MSMFDPEVGVEREFPKKRMLIVGTMIFLYFIYLYADNPFRAVTFQVIDYNNEKIVLPYEFELKAFEERPFRLTIKNQGSRSCWVEANYNDDVEVYQSVEVGEMLPKTTLYVELVFRNLYNETRSSWFDIYPRGDYETG